MQSRRIKLGINPSSPFLMGGGERQEIASCKRLGGQFQQVSGLVRAQGSRKDPAATVRCDYYSVCERRIAAIMPIEHKSARLVGSRTKKEMAIRTHSMDGDSRGRNEKERGARICDGCIYSQNRLLFPLAPGPVLLLAFLFSTFSKAENAAGSDDGHVSPSL